MMKRILQCVLATAMFLFCTGFWWLPHDPAKHGCKPVQEVVQKEGRFIMRRYKVKAPLLMRVTGGNPNRTAHDKFDTVVIVSDLKTNMLAHISHWETDFTIKVTPEGIASSGGQIEWKNDLKKRRKQAAEQIGAP